eukprot:2011387-Lingulodinium_polyedra.AAC.1
MPRVRGRTALVRSTPRSPTATALLTLARPTAARLAGGPAASAAGAGRRSPLEDVGRLAGDVPEGRGRRSSMPSGRPGARRPRPAGARAARRAGCPGAGTLRAPLDAVWPRGPRPTSRGAVGHVPLRREPPQVQLGAGRERKGPNALRDGQHGPGGASALADGTRGRHRVPEHHDVPADVALRPQCVLVPEQS